MSSSAIQVQTISVTGNGKVHVGPSYVTRRSTSFDSKNRKEILDWLSPLTFHGTQERIKREALLYDQSKDLIHESYSAGQWLLESDEFDEWRSRKFPKLWYHGMPGAGKTVLASIIISHLLDLREKFAGKDSGTQIAYLYLSYKEQQNQSLEYLIGSIIRQLAEDHDQLPASLISAWQKAKKHGSRDPTQAELFVLFTDLTSERPTYIVLDGLDECRMDVRIVLMRMLVQIEKADIGLLLTSRILPDFDELSKGFRRVNITANPQDLNLFIDYEFNNNWRLTEYAKQDRRLRDDIKFGVGQKCNGMFLLASLHMRLLSSQLSLTSVRKKLQCLPEDLDATYDETLNRIEAMDSHKKNLAFDVLAWIVFSLRPLSIQELQHALAVEPGDPNFDSGRIFLKDDITAFCGGLVTIDQEVVRLVHYTTQSYFAKVAEYRFPGFHSVIVQTCASYLSLNILEQPDDEEAQLSYADYADDVYANPEEIDFQQPLRNGDTKQSVHFQSPKPRPLTHWAKCDRYPFVTYAASFIGQHLDHISDVTKEPKTLNLLLKLLRERPKRNFLARLLYQLRLLDGRDIDKLSLIPITPNYLAESINEDDDDDPVSYGGSDPGLEIEPANELTDENSLENFKNEEAEEELARILRLTKSDGSDSDHSSDSQNDDDDDDDNSADADDKENETGNTDDSDNFRARANSTASRDSSSESSSVVSRVQSTPRPRLPQSARKESPQMTALHLACYLGNPSLVEIFAQETTDIDVLDPYSESSLVIAVKGNHFDAATVLLKHGASVNVMEKEAHAILLYSAQHGHVEFVQAILSQALGNVLVAEKKSFWLAFSLFAYIQAMFWVYLGRISILCQQNKNDITSAKGSAGAPIDPSKPRKEIPNSLKDHLRLLLAAASGDSAMVTGLIQSGKIKPKTENSLFYATALFFAIEFGHIAIVNDLLENGVSVDSSSLGGTTTLHRAVARNNIPIVKLLIEHKPNLEMKDNNGETAWAAHANQDHFEAVEILRRAGADPNTRGAEGVTGLYLAAAGGHVEQVKFLLGCGVNPSIRTVYGWAPLHWAAHNGKMECVQLLMDAGSDLNVLSDTSETPLDKARQGEQHVIAEILVEAGAKTAQEVYASQSPNSPSDNFYDRDDDYSEGNTVYSNWFDNFVKEKLSNIAIILIKLDSRTEVTTAHKRKAIQWVLKEVKGFRNGDRKTFKDETQVQWQDCVKVLEEKEKALLAEEALQIQEAPPTEDAPQSDSNGA